MRVDDLTEEKSSVFNEIFHIATVIGLRFYV
jgi:hypothetical protein